ncbi:SMP-30/gluconolactonase/LRE family protein [Natronospirillum operosum]|uniref:SMP-30/gluconolactonase/LRE family protein n=1 Tax=Natronospirillum operosum TaxID=2759953 RepID=A0A4Z0WAT5_9GAMM|nr:SMP-30/gluconolactonase/LRE family protein [Natronospirillum operosum]TGG93475.1 SMP-30/gluconolactonase/LRE family protein [Natronospirillum operosum]
MQTALKPVQTIAVANRLGEGIQWHADSGSLWWTDILSCRLYRLDWSTQQQQVWTTPERLTAFGILSTDPVKLLVSFESGFALYHPDEDRVHWLARPEQGVAGNRFNDGRVDRQGRFWSGTMVEDDQGQTGTLYRLDEQGAHPMLKGLSIPNALCWSPDGRVMYHADTPTGLIRRFDFDAATGSLSGARDFARVPTGNPDGACIDAEGHLLCALWGGHGLVRFAPDGRQTTLHELPVSQPTCVALGGPEMNLLFVSSAREGLSDEALAAEPLAGSVLVYETPYQGLVEMVPAPGCWLAGPA